MPFASDTPRFGRLGCRLNDDRTHFAVPDGHGRNMLDAQFCVALPGKPNHPGCNHWSMSFCIPADFFADTITGADLH
ncbi:hypothetical protein BH23BAC4_BH23BAC4_15500 [soil metagenome]